MKEKVKAKSKTFSLAPRKEAQVARQVVLQAPRASRCQTFKNKLKKYNKQLKTSLHLAEPKELAKEIAEAKTQQALAKRRLFIGIAGAFLVVIGLSVWLVMALNRSFVKEVNVFELVQESTPNSKINPAVSQKIAKQSLQSGSSQVTPNLTANITPSITQALATNLTEASQVSDKQANLATATYPQVSQETAPQSTIKTSLANDDLLKSVQQLQATTPKDLKDRSKQAALDNTTQALTKELDKLKETGKAKTAEYNFIKGCLAQADNEYLAAEAAYASNLKALNQQQTTYDARLVALFETQKATPTWFDLLVNSHSIDDFLAHYEFTRLLADSDHQMIEHYLTLQETTKRNLEQANQKQNEYQELLKTIAAQLANLKRDISLKEQNLIAKKHAQMQAQLLAAQKNKPKSPKAYDQALDALGKKLQANAEQIANLAKQGIYGRLAGAPQPDANEAKQKGLDAKFADNSNLGVGDSISPNSSTPANTGDLTQVAPIAATKANVVSNDELAPGQVDGAIVTHGPGVKPELQKLPWVFPNTYSRVVTCKFGYFDSMLYNSYPHRGTDFQADFGTKVVAALPGTVEVVNNPFEGENYSSGGSSYGNYIVINHGNGLKTLYAHLKSAIVQVGQTVAAGELIALAGSTGNSEGPHLHFEVQYYGELQDPYLYVGNC